MVKYNETPDRPAREDLKEWSAVDLIEEVDSLYDIIEDLHRKLNLRGKRIKDLRELRDEFAALLNKV